jgi:hypothetical protein
MRGYLNSQVAVASEKGPDNRSERVASTRRHRRQHATVFSIADGRDQVLGQAGNVINRPSCACPVRAESEELDTVRARWPCCWFAWLCAGKMGVMEFSQSVLSGEIYYLCRVRCILHACSGHPASHCRRRNEVCLGGGRASLLSIFGQYMCIAWR